MQYSLRNLIGKDNNSGKACCLKGKMTEYTGGIHNPCDGNMSHWREVFVNSSTWVLGAIGNGYVSQVLFLSQRSINSNDQAVRMPGKNLFACVTKV